MASPKALAAKFLGAAQRNPSARREICQEAARTFMGLAHDPRNVRQTGQLAKIGIEFADAAIRAQPITMDDFTDLLHETAQAHEASGGDAMDEIAIRREVHDERTTRDPGNVSIAPASFNKD